MFYRMVSEYGPRKTSYLPLNYKKLLNPLPNMPILSASNSAANKDMMSKV